MHSISHPHSPNCDFLTKLVAAEITEYVTSWITSDGNDTLQRFGSLQLDSESAIKEQEQEFEKYYFISMKHLAKGRDLHDAAVNIEPLRESAVNLKSALDCFAEKLELARERIEAATRLYQLLLTHQLEAHLLQEAQRLAQISGATQLLEKFRQEQRENSNDEPTTDQTEITEITNNNKNNKPNSLNLTLNYRSNSTTNSLTKQQQLQQQLQHVAVITSTPLPRMNRLSHRSSSGIGSFDGQTCQCWRESRNMEDMDEMLDADGEELEMEDGEEEQSKVADSGVGGCERCEGNLKLTRVCSCQSLNEAVNLYSKSDELDFECYERPIKHYNDIHSPMEANAHLQYHASSLELSKLDEISCLDPKIQKTLLLIMREMIGTERDYVHSLNYVIENYVDELLREDIPQPLRGQRNVIFGNIEKIFEFHKWHFLNELERYERNPLKVGSAFLEMESKFYLYALYNKNKPKSDTLMSEYGTAFFKSKQFELNDKMDLASYLLKPVQRMGKYALLLQQLVKACNSVEGAALQEIAADVEELHRAEEMVKFQLRHGNDLLAMDSLRDCDVNVKEQGRLLRQNEFLVWQGRTGRKSLRQVFLFEDLVLFSKARRFPDQKNLDIYIYKNSIKTSDIGLTAHVGDSKTKFEIWFRKRKPEDTWTLQCMSEDIKNAWADEISKLLWKQANRNRGNLNGRLQIH
uniref:Pleckstrin y domain-containing family G member 4B n=1 Tax=Bactrocera latifrons TaxID=174628 RepID=A0A0K8V0Y1_BACLA